MHKKPLSGPMIVNEKNIEGDSFDYKGHGTPDSVLYAIAVKSIQGYADEMAHLKSEPVENYQPGDLGENLTLDDFDEKLVSVGDIFQIGEVLAQATYPRIPCGKVNISVQHMEAKKRLEEHGRTGVYFRILKPGRILSTDQVVLKTPATTRISIHDVFTQLHNKRVWTDEEKERARQNGAFPEEIKSKFKI